MDGIPYARIFFAVCIGSFCFGFGRGLWMDFRRLDPVMRATLFVVVVCLTGMFASEAIAIVQQLLGQGGEVAIR